MMLLLSLMLAASGAQDMKAASVPPEVLVAYVSGPRSGEGLAELEAFFQEQYPGYAIQTAQVAGEAGQGVHAVTFIQAGEGRVSIEGGEPIDLRVGDLVLQRPGKPHEFHGSMETVTFLLPADQVLDAAIPDVVRPDFDPKLSDRPGGCATDPGAYRRLLLTWNPDRGPYVHRGFNCHRVRIDDSFSHFHPVDGGFDEFYLVQEAPKGAVLLVSRRTSDLLSDSVREDELEQVMQRIPLEAGQLIMIPRGVTHRGMGGAVVQVLAVPGFKPGQEIAMDEAIRRVNGRFALTGQRALPSHE